MRVGPSLGTSAAAPSASARPSSSVFINADGSSSARGSSSTGSSTCSDDDERRSSVEAAKSHSEPKPDHGESRGGPPCKAPCAALWGFFGAAVAATATKPGAKPHSAGSSSWVPVSPSDALALADASISLAMSAHCCVPCSVTSARSFSSSRVSHGLRYMESPSLSLPLPAELIPGAATHARVLEFAMGDPAEFEDKTPW